MVVIVLGYQYNEEEYCRFGAPQFLLLGGGICVATTLINIIAYLTPCEWDDKIADILSTLAPFVSMVVTIWGSVVIFSKFYTKNMEYKNTQYNPKIQGGPPKLSHLQYIQCDNFSGPPCRFVCTKILLFLTYLYVKPIMES